jgi:hypothetical protein
MTDRPPPDDRHPSSQGVDDPTRDIRLPPLPPPPYHSPDDEPTDQLRPPSEPVRQSTVAFESPPDEPEPGPTVAAPPDTGPDADTRKWPWVLLVLLPLVVIAVAGLVLALLLGG